MLAAHRAGGRTNFISFAQAWDRFAFRDAKAGKARRATERELLILRTHLEASLLEDEGPAPDCATRSPSTRAARRAARSGGPARVPRPATATAAASSAPAGLGLDAAGPPLDDYERALARLSRSRPSASASPTPRLTPSCAAGGRDRARGADTGRRGEERRTSPLELLWDLVFVFAVTQVTALLSADLDLGAASARRCSCSR